MLQTLDGANYSLHFEVFWLACGNSPSLTLVNPLLGREAFL